MARESLIDDYAGRCRLRIAHVKLSAVKKTNLHSFEETWRNRKITRTYRVLLTAREPDRRSHYPSEVPGDKSLRRQTGCLYVGEMANMIEQLQFHCCSFRWLQLSSLDVNQHHPVFR